MRYLSEKYFATYKIGSRVVEVFKNPTKRELKSAGGPSWRFAVSTEEDIFVWDVMVTHDQIVPTLESEYGLDLSVLHGGFSKWGHEDTVTVELTPDHTGRSIDVIRPYLNKRFPNTSIAIRESRHIL